MEETKDGDPMMMDGSTKPQLDSSQLTNKQNGELMKLNGKRSPPSMTAELLEEDNDNEMHMTKKLKLMNGEGIIESVKSTTNDEQKMDCGLGTLEDQSSGKAIVKQEIEQPQCDNAASSGSARSETDHTESCLEVKTESVKDDVVESEPMDLSEEKAVSNGHHHFSENKLDNKYVQAIAADDQAMNKLVAEEDSVKQEDTPMDLTRPSTSNTPIAESTCDESAEPYVITLSDSEDELQEVLLLQNEQASKARKILLRKYREQLRNEEAKLVLLKKLRQSQVQPKHDTVRPKTMEKTPTVQAHSRGSSSTNNAPPLLKRGSTPNHAGTQSPHLQKSSSGHHSHMSHSSSSKSSGPPPLVNMAHKSSSSSSQHHNGAQSGTSSGVYNYQNQQVPPARPKVATPPQITPEQRQAQAKQALRKQLEKTLLQIPPPKPPPPEMNFLPSGGSGEFTYLVGMEEVVKYLLESEKKQVKYVFNPFTCVQCKSDYTPVWKRDKPGSKNVICEQCVTTNQKRVLKQEHTSRLKAAFVKAVEQEQEIEQRISSGSPVLELQPPAPAPAQPAAHQSSSHSTPAMPQLTSAQLRQHQSLLQLQATEQMRAMLSAQAMASLPYQLYGVANKQAADLQRQYLLDMINPHQRSSWKT